MDQRNTAKKRRVEVEQLCKGAYNSCSFSPELAQGYRDDDQAKWMGSSCLTEFPTKICHNLERAIILQLKCKL